MTPSVPAAVPGFQRPQVPGGSRARPWPWLLVLAVAACSPPGYGSGYIVVPPRGPAVTVVPAQAVPVAPVDTAVPKAPPPIPVARGNAAGP